MRKRTAAATEVDRLWLDFRDLFGALWGLRVAERVPLEVQPHKSNINYLRTKQEKLGHLFSQLARTEK